MRYILFVFYAILETFSSNKYRYFIGIEKVATREGTFRYQTLYVERTKTFSFAKIKAEDSVIYLRKTYPNTKFIVSVTEIGYECVRLLSKVT